MSRLIDEDAIERDMQNEVLRYVPTVDAVSVVHGMWVFNENDGMFYCTNCKNGSVRNDYPYCHWCGAKMDEVKDSAKDINVVSKSDDDPSHPFADDVMMG